MTHSNMDVGMRLLREANRLEARHGEHAPTETLCRGCEMDIFELLPDRLRSLAAELGVHYAGPTARQRRTSIALQDDLRAIVTALYGPWDTESIPHPP